MNNFRIPKQPRRRGSIDGFVPNNQPSAEKRFLKSHQPNGTMAGFDRPDGFYTSSPDQAPVRPLPSVRPALSKNFSVVAAPAIESRERRWLRRKKKEKRPRSRRAKILRGAGASVLALILIVGGLLGFGYLKARNIFNGNGEGAAALEENVDPTRLRGEGDGRVNILILGKGGPGHTAPDLTDTILLASIDPVQKEAALLSIPRDMYIKNERGAAMKINSVYATEKERSLSGTRRSKSDIDNAEKAGTSAAMKAAEDVIGLPMHYYIMVDFEAFRKAIDTVGGIDINVTKAVYEQMRFDGRNYILDVKTGWQHFDGLRALAFTRSRYTSARGDFDRSERQRQVMVALKDRILSVGTFANPVKLYQLLSTFGDNVRTDIGGLGEVTRMLDIGKEIPSDKITSIGLADEPQSLVTTGMVAGQSVVMPRAGLYNYTAIHNFVRNNIRDGYLKNENASVVILNGTNRTGLASKTADELRSYGYNVVRVGDAPSHDYTNTSLVDRTNGAKKYTKNYLEKRLGVTATGQVPDAAIDTAGADFVIIVGLNEANRQQD